MSTAESISNTDETAETPTAVTLNDLQLLVQIVDLASARGAFRGNELAQVGQVYDKVSGFLQYVAEQQEKEQAKTEESGE
jgi:hypothetical protein